MQSNKEMNVTACYESDTGGETVAAQAIIQALNKRPGIRVIARGLPPLIHTDSLRFFYWVFWSICGWLVFLWKRHSVDWVYTTTFTAGVAAAILKPLFHFHILWHVHGTRVPPTPDGLHGKIFITQWIKRHVVYYLHAFFLRRTDVIIVPSLQGRNDVRREFGRLPIPRVLIIPNGVDSDRFTPASRKKRSALRREYGIPEDAKVMLSVGRLEKHKGIKTLLLVFSHLGASDPTAVLLLAYPTMTNPSERAYKTELEAAASALGIQTVMIWKEGTEKMEEVYQTADVVVSLSQRETYGLPILESFASGVLFMGTPVGAASRLLNRIDRRLRIPHTLKPVQIARRVQAILRLSFAEREHMRRIGLKIARQYTWGKTALGLEKVLRVFQG